MPPTPQYEAMEQPTGSSDILITGMSGRFPKSSSIKEFKENLINKVDMMDAPTERWEFSHPEMPPRLGICPDMETFDAQFFAIHYKQSSSMDPTIRKLLECACEAVIDAGINPKSLRHSNTGVFMASSISESEKNLNYDSSTISGYGLTGSSRSHMANRISFWLGTHGPSYSSDNACCGGALALQQAYHAMSQGYCDTAIVGSSNLCLEPCVNLHFRWMDLLTLGDKTKSFNKCSDGYLRSDAIVVFFLQKPKDAKRVYAQLVHTKTIYTGIKEIDHTFQMLYPERFGKFLNDFYKETYVKPHEVEYIEACGTGVNKADREELNQIDEVFCGKGRKDCVKVGSVKSNMGNCEASSPLAALVKVCLAYHTGKIAGNLHLENPMDDVLGVKEGRIKLLDDHNNLNKGYAAINTYSYNGVNGHILLKNYDIKRNLPVRYADIPYLICVSSRNEDTLKTTFEDLESKALDPRQMALVNNVYGNEVVGFLMRGYKIYSNETLKPEMISEGSEYFDGRQRPVWFVYSGMGSQWPTMGAQLMRFPVFAAAIEGCCRILDCKGLDLMKLLTDPDPDTFSNILHSFVAIAAVQIGLTDLLHSLGIKPDNIIGHSVGELGCAYADGCLTAEEMILSAYFRGLVSIESPLIKGSMAAVGLGYATMRSVCLPEIDVACHNGHDSSTISGPSDIMKVFVEELTKRGVFAKEVNCSSIAYHSRYIAAAGPGLKKYMSQVIKEPKLRSSRWVSSSVPQVRWDEAAARFCSAEYLTNNLLNPVLFEEASRLIPDNAITIEIAPHGLLQAILNRSLSTNCINVSLTRRGHKDNVQHVLNAIGRLYVAGLYPQLENLYPPVQFPVASDTPLLSHTLSWMHDEIWPVGCGRRPAPLNTGKYHYVLSTKDCDHAYLTGHFVNGINLYPAAAQLVLIWETLGIVLGIPYTELPVRFENVRFNADVVIPTDEPLELTVFLQQNSGNFEITKHGIAVASGVIIPSKKFVEKALEDPKADELLLKSDDIYRILAIRGYNYNGEFRSIKSTYGNFNKAYIDYSDNWVTFLDALMHFFMLSKSNTGVSRPRRFESLDIDVKKFNDIVEKLKRNQYLEATKYDEHGVISCAGVIMKEFMTEDFNATHNNNTLIYKHDFVPFNTEITAELEALKIHLQTIIENVNKQELRFVEILNSDDDISMKKNVQDILKELMVLTEINLYINWTVIKNKNGVIPMNNADVIITYKISSNEQILTKLKNYTENEIYILNIDNKGSLVSDVTVVSRLNSSKQFMLLNNTKPITKYHIIKTDQQNITSIKNEIMQYILKESVLLVATKQRHNLIDLIKTINKNNGGNKVHLLLIEDETAPKFDIKLPLYKEQLNKKLVVNVLKNGLWGSYRYIGFEELNKQTDNTELNIMSPGDIESLAWVTKAALQESPKISVKVHYARISSSDLIKVQKRKQTIYDEMILDRTFGMSYSGVTKSGERVMGLVKNNTISSVIEADPELLWPVPEYWSLKEAATVPRAYVQALYYLYDKSNKLPENMSVLVTNGSGALGQAIINVCLGRGCKVFTTVGDRRKKLLLLKMFPQLTENNVCASEDTTLLQMVAEGTNGEGCDLILSSVSGAKRLVTMNCLAPFSHFIDIGVEDMEDNAEFGMFFVSAGRAYLAANFASVFAENESPLRKTLRKTLYEGIQEGWVKPLSHVVYDSQQVSRAFRFLAGRRNHGAVLLRLRSTSSSTSGFNSISTWKCEESDCHVVVCEESSLGVEIAERLVQLGARNLVINNRKQDEYLQYYVKNWKSKGVYVKTLHDDLTSEEAATSFLTKAAEERAIKSLFIICTSEEEDAIKYLDSATRTHVNIGKFVIITTHENTMTIKQELLDVYENRLKEDLPSTLLQILFKNKQSKQKEMVAVLLDRAAKVLNKILCNNNANITVTSAPNDNKTVSKIVAEALGLLTIDGLDETLTIGDLELEQNFLNELCNCLVEHYHISYEISDILGLSLKELNDLEDNITDEQNANSNAFSIFFRHYETDNLFVSEPLTWMPTVISDGDNRVDFYKGEDYLIVVPGMDGHRHSMYRLCRRLRLRAILCQYPVEIKPNSIQELAQFLAQTIKTKIGIGSRFYILGYSFGALVALEMAYIFEKNGMEGKVFCLDGSPLSMEAIIKTQTLNLTEDQQQTQLLAHLYQIMTQKSEDITPKIETLANWDQKVKICIEELKGKIEDPFEYQELILKSAYKRFKFTYNYVKTNDKLRSEIVLLRAKGNLPLPKDYNLNVMSVKPVTLYELVSNHLSAPYDLRCSDIINRELDLDKASVEAAVARLNKLNSSIDGRMIR